MLEARHLGEVLDAELLIAEHERPIGAHSRLESRARRFDLPRAQLHLRAQASRAAEIGERFGHAHEEARFLQFRRALGEEGPGFGGLELEIARALTRQRLRERGEEGRGPGEARAAWRELPRRWVRWKAPRVG